MDALDVNVLIGGAAGQGMDTLAAFFQKVLQREGYHVLVTKDYMSRVRGGHNFIQIRFSDHPLVSHRDKLDVIVALDKQTVEEHLPRLIPDGKVLCDEKIEPADDRCLTFPINETAKEAGDSRMTTTVFLGLLLRFFQLSLDKAEALLLTTFQDDQIKENLEALQQGSRLIEPVRPLEPGMVQDRILINGNESVALGALAAGVLFYSGYPMTPSTSIMNYLASKQGEAGLVVEQAEDEIAAINMAIGANYAGIRAMTGTSGGGFSLMTEALGLAGITETPLVVIDVQRPGPATGFPTRTEQSDLSFLLTASHGEIPRMITALRSPEDAFEKTIRAWNLAEQYQIPVLLLSDQYLADTARTVPPFDFSSVDIQRHLADPDEYPPSQTYQRYAFTSSGVSPRLVPGKASDQVVLADSDEHDEDGHITESADMRIRMMEKRMGKMALLEKEVEEPWQLGSEHGETLLIAWGSLSGPVEEAVERLQAEDISVTVLIFGDLWPLPIDRLTTLVPHASRIVAVEQNYTGQLAKLIRQETGIACTHKILKFDGRPFSGEEIVTRLKEEVLNHD